MSDVPPEMVEADRLIREFVAKISEHVDCVTIFINKRREDGKSGTWNLVLGAGNWYARYGHVLDWVDEQRATTMRPEKPGDD